MNRTEQKKNGYIPPDGQKRSLVRGTDSYAHGVRQGFMYVRSGRIAVWRKVRWNFSAPIRVFAGGGLCGGGRNSCSW